MRTPRAQDGAVLLLVALSLTVLLGMAALVADLGQFRAHRRQLQTAADAGALAGALQLPPFSDGSNSCARADTIERQNTNLTDGKNMVVNGNLSTSYCEIIGGSVRVKPVESSVPYIFGQVLGFASTTIDARARARVVYLTRSTGLLPFGVEDLRPKSVTIIIDKTGQRIPLALCGSQTPEGFPYWCNAGGNAITGLPAGGSTVSLEVVDNTNKVIDWSNARLRRLRPGADHRGDGDRPAPLANPASRTCVLSPADRSVSLLPVHLDAQDVRRPCAPEQRRQQRERVHSPSTARPTARVPQTCARAPTARGTWSPASGTFTSATTRRRAGQDITVTVGTGKNALKTAAPAQHSMRATTATSSSSGMQERHYIDPSLPAN